MVRDRGTGKYRRTRLFVLTLGCSRKSVRLLVWRSSAQIWAELHERAFRRLGGTVRVIILDNLREGVLTPDIYDPTLNPLYRDVLAHYGVIALPCRVGDPDRNARFPHSHSRGIAQERRRTSNVADGRSTRTPSRSLRALAGFQVSTEVSVPLGASCHRIQKPMISTHPGDRGCGPEDSAASAESSTRR